MRYILPIIPLMATAMATAGWADTLNIYTYDSFASEWGPGPAIEKGFEAQCDCDLVFTPAGDGAAMLSRLRIEGDNSKADIVLGLDQNLISLAEESALFANLEREATEISGAKITWEHPLFMPFDWGHFAFVYRSDEIETPPTSLEALAKSDLRIVIEDPRSSTPGLGLAVWAQAVFGDEVDAYWGALADNIVTITPGWSEAYAIFLEGEADAVLSYSTSPAYHRIAEDDDRFAAMKFDHGHATQIELAGIMKSTRNAELAHQFLDYLHSEDAQAALMNGNWMYPVISLDYPEGFDAPDLFPSMETPTDAQSIDSARQSFAKGLAE